MNIEERLYQPDEFRGLAEVIANQVGFDFDFVEHKLRDGESILSILSKLNLLLQQKRQIEQVFQELEQVFQQAEHVFQQAEQAEQAEPERRPARRRRLN